LLAKGKSVGNCDGERDVGEKAASLDGHGDDVLSSELQALLVETVEVPDLDHVGTGLNGGDEVDWLD
jgi:hypothetical protein